MTLKHIDKDSSLLEWAEYLIERHWRQDGVIGEIALVPGAVMDDFQVVVEEARQAVVFGPDERAAIAYVVSFLDGYKAPEQVGCAVWDVADVLRRMVGQAVGS